MPATIRDLKKRIGKLPKSVAHSVAGRASPAMTTLTQAAFAGGKSVYGEGRPAGAGGKRLTLRDTGTTARTLRFTTTGTVVRAVLGTRYARYLIGKYGILPNGPLPAEWSRRLAQLVRETEVA